MNTTRSENGRPLGGTPGCGPDWWVSFVNPRARSYLDQLVGTVELTAARTVLREVITLAEQAPTLTDVQSRARLIALNELAVRRFR
ncbi:MAG TPA: hypothetical protein VFO16_11415 [Pseudonocardiaceae bacterium]|nr:hypothetical protein [Pseudonocardiaceae bacterium]